MLNDIAAAKSAIKGEREGRRTVSGAEWGGRQKNDDTGAVLREIHRVTVEDRGFGCFLGGVLAYVTHEVSLVARYCWSGRSESAVWEPLARG